MVSEFVLAGNALAVLVVLIRLWTWRQQSDAAARKAYAHKVLREHGMHVHRYLPAAGANSPELRAALTEFEYSGYMVLDRHNRVVGWVMPAVGDCSDAPAKGLRLVVDNTKGTDA